MENNSKKKESNEKKKGFLARWMDKFDKKLEEKSKGSGCCSKGQGKGPSCC